MNCHAFSDLLYEYLDGTLDAEVQAAARQHLQHCDACRHALLREQAFSNLMRQSLSQAAAGLSVRPGTRHRVLKAIESRSTSVWARLVAWKSFILIRPGLAAALLLGGVLLIFGTTFRHRSAQADSLQGNEQNGLCTCVIDVPIQTQSHVFRRQGNTVVDSIVADLSFAHAGLSEEGNQLPLRSRPTSR